MNKCRGLFFFYATAIMGGMVMFCVGLGSAGSHSHHAVHCFCDCDISDVWEQSGNAHET